MMAERLDVAAGLSRGLCEGSPALAARLSPVTGAFGEIAAMLAAHLPYRTPQAAIASPRSSPEQAGAGLEWPSLTAVAGEAAADAIEAVTGLRPAIKPPKESRRVKLRILLPGLATLL